MRYSFVKDTLVRLIQDGMLSRDDSILVVAGAHAENKLLRDLNFRDVTISNLDERMTGDEFAPFSWSFQDAHNLTYSDEQFDEGQITFDRDYASEVFKV
ncbi:MAG: hypothetical protein WD423_14710 [Rhodothermales bacterium]